MNVGAILALRSEHQSYTISLYALDIHYSFYFFCTHRSINEFQLIQTPEDSIYS
jgi:hypothetical protein